MQIAIIMVSIVKSRNSDDRRSLNRCNLLLSVGSRAAAVPRRHVDRRDDVLTLNRSFNLIE